MNPIGKYFGQRYRQLSNAWRCYADTVGGHFSEIPLLRAYSQVIPHRLVDQDYMEEADTFATKYPDIATSSIITLSYNTWTIQFLSLVNFVFDFQIAVYARYMPLADFEMFVRAKALPTNIRLLTFLLPSVWKPSPDLRARVKQHVQDAHLTDFARVPCGVSELDSRFDFGFTNNLRDIVLNSELQERLLRTAQIDSISAYGNRAGDPDINRITLFQFVKANQLQQLEETTQYVQSLLKYLHDSSLISDSSAT